MDRPEIVTDDMLEYLDELRDSGVVNMFGSRPYVMEEFDLDSKEAQSVVSYWMKTYGQRHEKQKGAL